VKPVDQTNFGKTGNCHQAAMASILELRLGEVPDFCNLYGKDHWHFEQDKWLLERFGMFVLTLDDNSAFDEWRVENLHKFEGVYHIIVGDSSRDMQHSCVGMNGEIVHDPHPSRTGLKEVRFYDFFIIADPSGAKP